MHLDLAGPSTLLEHVNLLCRSLLYSTATRYNQVCVCVYGVEEDPCVLIVMWASAVGKVGCVIAHEDLFYLFLNSGGVATHHVCNGHVVTCQ